MDSYLSYDELVKFIASLPTRRLAAAALIRNESGNLLAVKPNYKDGWTLPGGTVEEGEAPQPGCFREVIEEVGLELEPGRLLVLMHGLKMGIWGDSTYYIYDGGVIAEDTPITLQESELTDYRWVNPTEFESYFSTQFAKRLRAAYRALETGELFETVVDGAL